MFDEEDRRQSDYFSICSFDENRGIEAEVKKEKPSKLPQEAQTTLQTTKMSMIHKYEGDESYLGELADIVEKFPHDFLPTKKQENNLNRSMRMDKSKDRMSTPARSCWLNDTDLKCIIDFQGQAQEGVCRFANGQLSIVDTGCSFKIDKITKIKALFHNYQRCLWLTCSQAEKGGFFKEIKFKISIANDTRDELYLLFSRIIIAKLILASCEIDHKQEDSPEVDRFMMTGTLLKKSQIMGRWDERRVVITDRIQSFRNQTCTFQITGVKEVWTRFQMYQNRLVVKVRHGAIKTELALPIVNFNARFCKENWLYRVYRLISASSV